MGFFNRRPVKLDAATCPPPPPPPSYEQSTAAQPIAQLSPWVPPAVPQGSEIRGRGYALNVPPPRSPLEINISGIELKLAEDPQWEQFYEQMDKIVGQIDQDQTPRDVGDDEYAIYVSSDASTLPVHPASEQNRAIRALTHDHGVRRTRPRATKISIWTKVEFYSNSRLPKNLPPLCLYTESWAYLTLAARYANSAYAKPTSHREKELFVEADPRLGTKAMLLKASPDERTKSIVLAVRGTVRFNIRDWGVNLQTAPTSPQDFLQDEGNLCHAGFLKVAKHMVRRVALQLREILDDNPSREQYSLIMTGHSAGGAVAALLYAHMLSGKLSELSQLLPCFKRVHCFTFGAPPVSILPLTKPVGRQYQKWMFFSFINEGDLVTRAELPYLKSLALLMHTPAPRPSTSSMFGRCRGVLDRASSAAHFNIHRDASETAVWRVPQATLSNAGRQVVLRTTPQYVDSTIERLVPLKQWEKLYLAGVTACTVEDETLRTVVYGNLYMHEMKVYLRRIETLAKKAVGARV